MSRKNTLIGDEISSLKDKEIYSLLLFVLFKLREDKEYSTLSELAYILEKDDFLNICEYFGGLTIKIPTIDELKNLIRLLVLYQTIKIEGKSLEESIKLLGYRNNKKIIDDYSRIESILEKYQFFV